MRNAFVVLILAASLGSAQGPRARHNQQQGTCLDPAAVQTIDGTVAAVNIAYGAQYPSIEVNKVLIKLAPVWYLIENEFEVRAGDVVSIAAAPCDSYLYAIRIANVTTATSITLRDSDGVPLWSNAGAGRSARAGMGLSGGRAGGGCLDPASIQTVSGVAESVTYGAGIQLPVLTLKTSGGALIAMKIGPERILLAADFELKPGDAVTAAYAHATCTDEFVALELTNAAGVTVVLRPRG